MLDCRERGAVAVVASDSAIEPLAKRAAELFQVPLLRVTLRTDQPADKLQPAAMQSSEPAPAAMNELMVMAPKSTILDRDALVTWLGDRVDVVSVRSGGKIAHHVSERIRELSDASTRVAVLGHNRDIARALISLGGVGWYLGTSSKTTLPESSTGSDRCPAAGWMRESGSWLVHCTRGTSGAWPGESTNTHRDELLLVDQVAPERTAFETLVRIVRGRRLLASCRTSDRRWPVVCFSAVSLSELLDRRQYRSHLHRWDYEPHGIAIRISAAERLGIRRVHYGDPSDRDRLPIEDRFLFQARGKTFDWTREQEWRCNGSVELDALASEDVHVFTQTEDQANALRGLCTWHVNVCGPSVG